MKNRKVIVIAVNVILIVLNLVFIWGSSLDSKEASKAKSESVAVVVEPVLETFVGEGNVTDNLVRKLAHITEFAVLGALVSFLFYCLKYRISQIILFGMFVALIDETVQLFSNRGSQVQDIWVDMLGFAIGVLVVSVVYFAKKVYARHCKLQTSSKLFTQ